MGKFIVKSGSMGVMFELTAANNVVIAGSEFYTTKSACLKGIESLRHNAASKVEDQTVKGFEILSNPKYELYKDKRRQYRYRLKARNGKLIAVGGAFATKDLCMSSIESVRRNAPKAKIIEVNKP